MKYGMYSIIIIQYHCCKASLYIAEYLYTLNILFYMYSVPVI